MTADGWKKQAIFGGTDVTAPVKERSRRTQLEMAVGFLQSRNNGFMPDGFHSWSEDDIIARAMLEKEFNPHPKDVVASYINHTTFQQHLRHRDGSESIVASYLYSVTSSTNGELK